MPVFVMRNLSSVYRITVTLRDGFQKEPLCQSRRPACGRHGQFKITPCPPSSLLVIAGRSLNPACFFRHVLSTNFEGMKTFCYEVRRLSYMICLSLVYNMVRKSFRLLCGFNEGSQQLIGRDQYSTYVRIAHDLASFLQYTVLITLSPPLTPYTSLG